MFVIVLKYIHCLHSIDASINVGKEVVVASLNAFGGIHKAGAGVGGQAGDLFDGAVQLAGQLHQGLEQPPEALGCGGLIGAGLLIGGTDIALHIDHIVAERDDGLHRVDNGKDILGHSSATGIDSINIAGRGGQDGGDLLQDAVDTTHRLQCLLEDLPNTANEAKFLDVHVIIVQLLIQHLQCGIQLRLSIVVEGANRGSTIGLSKNKGVRDKPGKPGHTRLSQRRVSTYIGAEQAAGRYGEQQANGYGSHIARQSDFD